MPPAFLNSREDAILFWAAVIIGYATYKDPRGIAAGFAGVVRALLRAKVLLVFGSTLLYCALVVYGAEELGLWHESAVKATLYWFIGTGVVLVSEAVTQTSENDADFLRRVVRRVIAVTVLVEFVVNLYVFPFAFELVGAFVVLAFSGMQVVVQHDPSADPRVRKVIDGVLIAVGLCYLIYSAVKGLSGSDGLLTRENAEDFLVGPALTVVLVPFLYGLVWLSPHERENLRKRWRSASNSPASG